MRSGSGCAAKNSGVSRRRVASSATAFAPFSQNSAAERCAGSGSGQAQPGQSNPSAWLSSRRVVTLRRTPIWATDWPSACATPGTPAA